jgi:DNA mismatch repair protein MutL
LLHVQFYCTCNLMCKIAIITSSGYAKMLGNRLKIRVLSDETINKIAAGEVIENPASVVKELVENAIDAGASEIRVEMRGGGLQLIRVADNGSGMNQDEALLCWERHATSKIRSAEDLLRLQTMGFRGEALASIASISKVTLLTSQGDIGTKIEIEGGRLLQTVSAARARGTTIEVRSLFYNIPARKKFQKSAAITGAEIRRAVAMISLAYPEIAFSLFDGEREALSLLPSQSFLHRASDVLGEDFCKNTHPLQSEQFQGFVGHALQNRSNRSGQYLFINRRFLTSSSISYAVKDGFATRIAETRFPIYLLFLTLSPESFDVNVHPQKKEVRFQDEMALKQKIREAVRQALNEQSVTYTPQFTFFPNEEMGTISPCEKIDFPRLLMKEPVLFEEKPHFFGLFCHYLLLEEEGKLALVDLVAARARIAFEQMTQENEKVQKQGLLFPITFELGALEAREVLALLELLDEIGIAIRPFGDNAFIVDALIPFIEEASIPQVIVEMIHELEGFALEEKRRESARILSSKLQHGKKSFVLQEAIALYEALKKIPSHAFCPRGKKTIIRLDSHDIKKRLFEKA